MKKVAVVGLAQNLPAPATEWLITRVKATRVVPTNPNEKEILRALPMQVSPTPPEAPEVVDVFPPARAHVPGS